MVIHNELYLLSSETQSLRMSNGKKKSNYKFTTYPIRSKTSQRKIDNNIQEKLFQAKIHTYKAKQKVLLDNIKEVIKVHKKCIKMSKQSTQPKNRYFEDIELVVARIVDEAFGVRVQTHDKNDEETIVGRGAKESEVPMLGVNDIRVWDRRSPDDEVLNSIAGKLLIMYGRLRAETHRLKADKERLRWLIAQSVSSADSPVDELSRMLDGDLQATGVPTVLQKRDLVEIITRVRDALSANREHRTSVTGNSCCGRRLHSVMATHELRELRARLTAVKDRLRAAEKDKRDLLDIVERSRSDPTTVESLQAVLSKEREKNVHLQSVVDDMFIAANRGA
ncbi:uncharacterized protein LOC111040420 [Myzus persicae]|uniref:uncharacterized protein LOC111040420 n=1 Tax=Myzus persicae TaxID=13164 RepID=UPI000B934809|nr:uncharacterized protein LOC111040420 [Myzus persicae]